MQRTKSTINRDAHNGQLKGWCDGLESPTGVTSIPPGSSEAYQRSYLAAFNQAQWKLVKEGPLHPSNPNIKVAAYSYLAKNKTDALFPQCLNALPNANAEELEEYIFEDLKSRFFENDPNFSRIFFRIGIRESIKHNLMLAERVKLLNGIMGEQSKAPSQKRNISAVDEVEESKNKRQRLGDVPSTAIEINDEAVHSVAPQATVPQTNWQFFSVGPARLQPVVPVPQPQVQPRYVLAPIANSTANSMQFNFNMQFSLSVPQTAQVVTSTQGSNEIEAAKALISMEFGFKR